MADALGRLRGYAPDQGGFSLRAPGVNPVALELNRLAALKGMPTKNIRSPYAVSPADEAAQDEALGQQADQYAALNNKYNQHAAQATPDYGSPQEIAVDHSMLGSALESIWPNMADAPAKYRQAFQQFPDMGMEDFWRNLGPDMEKRGISRDDFFRAVGREP